MTELLELARLLEHYRYDTATEDAVQRGIAKVLGDAGIAFEREVPVPHGRLDFRLADGTAIEVKLRGSTNDLLRQLGRYADLPEVERLLVVTTRHRLAQVPREIAGKPVRVALLLGSVL